MRSILFSLALAVLGCNAPELGTETSSAETSGGDAGTAQGGDHPAEAVDACDGKASGDACGFTDARNGAAVTGTCRSCHDGVLACGSGLPHEGDGGPTGSHGGRH